MKALRLAVGILSVVLASKTCALAMEQDVPQPSEASVRQADPPVYRAQQALSATDPVDNPKYPALDESQSMSPATAKSQDDCLGGIFRRSCNDPCPSVYGQVEALFMKRQPRLIDQPIVVDPNTNTTFLSTSDLDFNFDPGIRATVGARLCGGRALEFSYFGLFQGDASAVAVKPDDEAFLIFPDNLFGNVFVGMDRTEVNYSSQLHSFELNLPCCCGCCDECPKECGCGECRDAGGGRGDRYARCQSLEWFGGLRYIYLGEELDILAEKTVAGELENGSYNLRTTNHLYGVQVGARFRRTQNRFGWEVAGKSGIFGNNALEKQSVTDFPDFPLRPTVSSSGAGAAFVGEINLSALYRLTEVWNLRGGYNAMWIEGLALAPDQLDFDFAASPSGNQLHRGGGMFLHGVSLGLEARW